MHLPSAVRHVSAACLMHAMQCSTAMALQAVKRVLFVLWLQVQPTTARIAQQRHSHLSLAAFTYAAVSTDIL
jgi:hypothetical protein